MTGLIVGYVVGLATGIAGCLLLGLAACRSDRRGPVWRDGFDSGWCDGRDALKEEWLRAEAGLPVIRLDRGVQRRTDP